MELSPIVLVLIIAVVAGVLVAPFIFLKQQRAHRAANPDHPRYQRTPSETLVIPAPVDPSVDPMDPRGDGTIREGDEMWDIFKKTMEGNTVIGNRQDDGSVELQVFPLEDPKQSLVPESAFPADLTDEQRSRVEEKLAADQHTIPTAPGKYTDRTGDLWTLNWSGTWTDSKGVTKPSDWSPLIAVFGPMTPVDGSSREI